MLQGAWHGVLHHQKIHAVLVADIVEPLAVVFEGSIFGVATLSVLRVHGLARQKIPLNPQESLTAQIGELHTFLHTA